MGVRIRQKFDLIAEFLQKIGADLPFFIKGFGIAIVNLEYDDGLVGLNGGRHTLK